MTDRTRETTKAPVLSGVFQTPTRRNLHDLRHLRLEATKIYREARDGQLDPTTAAKLIYILGECRKFYELEQIEARIEELEQRA